MGKKKDKAEFTSAMRLQQWMDEHNATQTDILIRCQHYSEKYGIEVSKSLLSHYVAGDSEIGQKRLFILAKALNVSPVWLMGYDVSSEPEEEVQKEVGELKQILYMLNSEGRKKLMEYASDLIGNKKYIEK